MYAWFTAASACLYFPISICASQTTSALKDTNVCKCKQLKLASHIRARVKHGHHTVSPHVSSSALFDLSHTSHRSAGLVSESLRWLLQNKTGGQPRTLCHYAPYRHSCYHFLPLYWSVTSSVITEVQNCTSIQKFRVSCPDLNQCWYKDKVSASQQWVNNCMSTTGHCSFFCRAGQIIVH